MLDKTSEPLRKTGSTTATNVVLPEFDHKTSQPTSARKGSTMSTFVWMLKSLHVRRFALVIGFCLAMPTAHASAHEHFGKVHFPIACNPGMQDEFDQALAMLHTFSFPAAAETFMGIAQKDPDCAMAYWGIAATAIGSLFGGRPGPMALQGEQAVEKAKVIGGKNARERDYVATVE